MAAGNAIDQLDLGSISARLRKEYQWPASRISAATRRYKLFLRSAVGRKDAVPMNHRDADEVWHLHILDSQKYARDCETIFGSYFHHIPGRPGGPSYGKCKGCQGD